MVDANNFFDLYDVLVNEVIGSQTLFFAIGLIVVLIITLKTRMNYHQTMLIALLWSMIYVAMTLDMRIWAIIGMVVLSFFGWAVARALTRS